MNFTKSLRLSVAAAAFSLVAAPAFAQDVKVDEKEIAKLAKDAGKMAEAEKKYAAICAACHGPKGAGLIGPNLTDMHFIKGGSAQAIASSIAIGNPQKGMPAMTPLVGGPEGVKLLTAYVLNMKGKNLPGKPPEGKPEK